MVIGYVVCYEDDGFVGFVFDVRIVIGVDIDMFIKEW